MAGGEQPKGHPPHWKSPHRVTCFWLLNQPNCPFQRHIPCFGPAQAYKTAANRTTRDCGHFQSGYRILCLEIMGQHADEEGIASGHLEDNSISMKNGWLFDVPLRVFCMHDGSRIWGRDHWRIKRAGTSGSARLVEIFGYFQNPVNIQRCSKAPWLRLI